MEVMGNHIQGLTTRMLVRFTLWPSVMGQKTAVIKSQILFLAFISDITFTAFKCVGS